MTDTTFLSEGNRMFTTLKGPWHRKWGWRQFKADVVSKKGKGANLYLSSMQVLNFVTGKLHVKKFWWRERLVFMGKFWSRCRDF